MARVLVTGGAGFIGSALAQELLKEKDEVMVYDNLVYGTKENLMEVMDQVELIMGDVLSMKFTETLNKKDVDYVYHLAAEPYIPHCYDNPEKFIDVNVKGTLNVLFSCKLAGVKRILLFSTSEVYGTADYIPMDERHPTRPFSTYAVSKLAADRLAYVFCHEHDIRAVIARPFNCYGPRETQPYVIPEIISQLSRGKVVRLGNIKAKRDFTYVHDTAKAAIMLMKSNVRNGEIVNIGSNVSYSIEELAKLVGEILGHERIEIVIDKTRLRPIDVDLLQCDHSKLHQISGWKPSIGIRRGLEMTIQWYMENGKRWPWEKIITR